MSEVNFPALDCKKEKYLFYYNVFIINYYIKKQINHTIYIVKVIYSYLNKINVLSN